jgi:N-acetylglutamate synthase-like GNAT family acetyltransferase
VEGARIERLAPAAGRNFSFEFLTLKFIILAMSSPNHRVRRATLEDLPGLKTLWNLMHLPVYELEKRLTEFQVVESSDRQLIGALGIQIFRQHAWLHSESYRDFAVADEVRPLLMERIQSLASNHGVFRLWTREKSPFWTRRGFQPATPEALKKLPEAWTGSGSDWLTLQLKDEHTIGSVEKELALFMESEKLQTQRTLQQARAFKVVATVVALILAIFVAGAVLYIIQKSPALLNRAK